MSKKTGYLLGILFTIIIGMLLKWFICCGSGATSGTTDKSNQVVGTEKPSAGQMGFAIKDPNGNFSFSDKNNLDFNASGFSIIQPVSGAVNNGIGKLQAYLNTDGNNGKSVDITGYYDSDEKNSSAFPNLGLARANAVKNYFVSKGIPSSRINTYGELRASLVPDGTIYRGPVSYGIGTATNSQDLMGFVIKDPNGNFSFSDKNNLDFNASGFSIIQPVSGAVNNGIGKLQAYLNTDGNNGKSVDITGYYDSDEKNSSAFPNLGLARANAVKNYFVSKGIPSSRINTYGELRASLVPDGTIYRGPVSYGIGTATSNNGNSQDLAELKKRINANPLVLYFDTSRASIALSKEQRQKVADINKYLDKVPNASISIVGHTDSRGNRTNNISLGRNRANFARDYFIRNGISNSKIKTSSKGPDAPIADNGTPQGRAKNRRSVVTLN